MATTIRPPFFNFHVLGTRKFSSSTLGISALRCGVTLRTYSSNCPIRNRTLTDHTRLSSTFLQFNKTLNHPWNATSFRSKTYDAGPTSFPDPGRPDLFYHLVPPPNPLSPALPVYALSFLPVPPATPDSSTVIGWLPAQTYEQPANTDVDVAESSVVNDEQTRQLDAGLHDFRENPRFVKLLHESIQATLRDGLDEIWINGALQVQKGWMHIHDQRNIPALGRIGDPDDIIASVLVEDSKILADTYQPMPSYRVCTTDGMIQLTPGLAQRLHDALSQIATLESTTTEL